MSYYCKGEICQRSKDCLRVEAWRGFQKKDIKEGFNTGVWFVQEQTCIKNGFEDGVFRDGERQDGYGKHVHKKEILKRFIK